MSQHCEYIDAELCVVVLTSQWTEHGYFLSTKKKYRKEGRKKWCCPRLFFSGCVFYCRRLGDCHENVSVFMLVL